MTKIIRIRILIIALCVVLTGGVVAGYAVHANSNTSYIGEEKAKSIALTHAGVKETDAEYISVKLDTDGMNAEYDVEFWVGNAEYDYEVDAVSGNITDYDFDIEDNSIPKSDSDNQSSSTEQSTASGAALTQTSSYIGEAEAKSIALAHAGVSESEVQYITCKLDYDDGVAEYDVDFLVGNTEYDYEILATSGKILSYDRDTDNDNNTSTTPPTTDSSTSYVGEAEAKSIALAHAGVSSSEVQYITCKLDYDDGVAEYDVDFLVGNTEYDYEILATSGKILSYDRDTDNDNNTSTTPPTTDSSTSYVGEAEAKSTALTHAGVSASEAGVVKCEFDFDDGVAEYEVEWKIGNTEYEYTVNAQTGSIIEFDVDYDD